MFYAARGSIPPNRHTQHRAADGSLYAEELFGVEGFTGRSSLLYHLVPPTRTHRIEPGATIRARGGRRRLPPPSADRLGRRPSRGRRGHRAHPAVLQHRHRHGRRPPGRARCRTASSTATARPTRCSSSTRARACSTPTSDRSATARATTSSCRSARPGGWSRTPARAQRMLYLECPSEIEAPEALSQRLRPAARALAVLAARHPAAGRGPAADRRGRLRRPRQDARPADGLPLHAPPVRRRRLGRLSVAVRVQHRRLRADHRARPPAAAGPPDVRGAELRRVLVRAPQVRLPPARDPGAVQPLEHQLGRGHLLRRRQLHEPSRRGDLVVHAAPGGHPARAAPGDRGGVHRQGGHRGAGGDGRHVPSAQDHAAGGRRSRTPATRTRGCRPRTPPARPANSRTADRRRSRTERPPVRGQDVVRRCPAATRRAPCRSGPGRSRPPSRRHGPGARHA